MRFVGFCCLFQQHVCSLRASCMLGPKCPGDPRLKSLVGWSPHSEFADILHVVWCGVARDATGSLLMDLAEHAVPNVGTSWDEKLAYLHSQCVKWCRDHRIRPSTVEEFSYLMLLAFFGSFCTACVNVCVCVFVWVCISCSHVPGCMLRKAW